jgi:hypothetical protein
MIFLRFNTELRIELELEPVGRSYLSRDSSMRFLRSNTELRYELELSCW